MGAHNSSAKRRARHVALLCQLSVSLPRSSPKQIWLWRNWLCIYSDSFYQSSIAPYIPVWTERDNILSISGKKQGYNMVGPFLYLWSSHQAYPHDGSHDYRDSGISSLQVVSNKNRIISFIEGQESSEGSSWVRLGLSAHPLTSLWGQGSQISQLAILHHIPTLCLGSRLCTRKGERRMECSRQTKNSFHTAIPNLSTSHLAVIWVCHQSFLQQNLLVPL